MKSKAGGSPDAEPSTSDKDLSNVLYLGHIPHGFYEDQMRGFFEQFGTVSKLRLSRNKKTGKSKHYAYLQFSTPDVASIVAGAMDGYMLMGQKLQCRVLLKSEIHEDLWKGANRRFRTIPWRKIEMKRHNAQRTPEQAQARLQRALARDRKRMQRLATSGIEYEYEPLEAPTKKLGGGAPIVDANKKTQGVKKAAAAPKAEDVAKVVEKAAKAKGRLADVEQRSKVVRKRAVVDQEGAVVKKKKAKK